MRWKGRLARAAKSKIGKGYKSRYEMEFARELAIRAAAGEILWWRYEPFRLVLSSDPNVSYTPDFAAVLADTMELVIYEVKGFPREDSMVKLKVAADEFPFRFFLVTKPRGKNGGFAYTEVGGNGNDNNS